MKKISIAIDGPSAAGKSSIAKNKDNKIAGCEVGSSYKDGQKTFCSIGSFERGYG